MTGGSARRLRTAAVAGLVAVTAGGCAQVATLPDPTPPPTPPQATTVAPLPDLTGVTPDTVAGSTTTTALAIGPGGASIQGNVTGQAGPVGGATVELTRLVGDASATIDTTTATDGTFAVHRLLGGAYRVRAWQAPVLALTTPQLFFVAGSDTKTVTLSLSAYSATTVTASTAPTLVGQGGYVEVAVSVFTQVVGADGVVRATPDPGQPVEVDGGGGWVPAGADPATTDGNGTAVLELQCAEIGAPALVVSVPGTSPVTAAGTTCVAAAPPTTAPPETVPDTTTTTTTSGGPTAGGTTTTTTGH